MAIRKPIELSWEGKPHKIMVTMEVIERIDDKLNILSFVKAISGDTPPISKVSKLIYLLLEEAGVKVTWQDVYDGFGDESKIDSGSLTALMAEILPSLLPRFNGVTKKKTRKTKKK